MSKDARTINFLGLEWSKKDLAVMATVLEEGLRSTIENQLPINPDEEKKIKKTVTNIWEIIE